MPGTTLLWPFKAVSSQSLRIGVHLPAGNGGFKSVLVTAPLLYVNLPRFAIFKWSWTSIHTCSIIFILSIYSSTTGCKTYEYAMLCVLQSIYVVTVYISDPIQLATVPDNCNDIADDCSLHRNFRKHLVENFRTMQVARFHVAEFSKLRLILYCNTSRASCWLQISCRQLLQPLHESLSPTTIVWARIPKHCTTCECLPIWGIIGCAGTSVKLDWNAFAHCG